MRSPHSFITLLACKDQSGINSAVSGYVSHLGGDIIESKSYHIDGTFYLRQEIDGQSIKIDFDSYQCGFKNVAKQFNMIYRMRDTSQAHRVIILAGKLEHCVADILYRLRDGEFKFNIPCIISNHRSVEDYAVWHGIPFHHIQFNDIQNREKSFQEIDRLAAYYKADTMVLARFMQIFPPELCKKYSNQIINIHHSFLPSFVGAKPYHQAHDYGVKLIGATCHYVTPDLDAGPIIEQDTIRVGDGDSVDDIIRSGREVERTVLSRGLKYHVEDRIIINGRRTIVFR